MKSEKNDQRFDQASLYLQLRDNGSVKYTTNCTLEKVGLTTSNTYQCGFKGYSHLEIVGKKVVIKDKTNQILFEQILTIVQSDQCLKQGKNCSGVALTGNGVVYVNPSDKDDMMLNILHPSNGSLAIVGQFSEKYANKYVIGGKVKFRAFGKEFTSPSITQVGKIMKFALRTNLPLGNSQVLGQPITFVTSDQGNHRVLATINSIDTHAENGKSNDSSLLYKDILAWIGTTDVRFDDIDPTKDSTFFSGYPISEISYNTKVPSLVEIKPVLSLFDAVIYSLIGGSLISLVIFVAVYSKIKNWIEFKSTQKFNDSIIDNGSDRGTSNLSKMDKKVMCITEEKRIDQKAVHAENLNGNSMVELEVICHDLR